MGLRRGSRQITRSALMTVLSGTLCALILASGMAPAGATASSDQTKVRVASQEAQATVAVLAPPDNLAGCLLDSLQLSFVGVGAVYLSYIALAAGIEEIYLGAPAGALLLTHFKPIIELYGKTIEFFNVVLGQAFVDCSTTIPISPVLRISPTSGPPGTVIANVATGCPPRSPGTISVFGGTGSQLLLQSRFITGDDGGFSQTPLPPFPTVDSTGTLLPPGRYPVVLVCGGKQATATFILTARPVKPMITISPTSGPPGTVIANVATGCPPRSPGTISVFGGTGSQLLLQSRFITGDDGGFSQTPLPPFPTVDSTGTLLPPGRYPVVLVCGGKQATATFILTG